MGRIILTFTLRGREDVGWIYLAAELEAVTGSCEHGNGTSDFHKKWGISY